MAYLTDDTWERVDVALASGMHVLLSGPPGTGKTHAALNTHVPTVKDVTTPARAAATRAVLALSPGTVYAITLDSGTMVSEVRGTWTLLDGRMVWQDGPAVLAARQGARLVLNEVDRASDEVLGFLYGLCDSPGSACFTLPSGEVIRPAHGFQAVATCNGPWSDLPEGIQSRFCLRVEVDVAAPSAILALPADLRNAARATIGLEDADRRLTLRHWHTFAALRERVSVEMAADLSFGRAASDVLDAITASAS